MALNIGGNEVNRKIIDSNYTSGSATVKTTSKQNIDMTQQNESIKKFCEEYNITPQQLSVLLSKHNDLFSLTPDKVKIIVQTELHDAVETVQEEKHEHKSVDASEQFNHKEYSELSVKEQFSRYASELAKNNFLYGEGNKHSIEEWNNLSEQEKQNLIANETKNLVKGDYKSYSGDKELLNRYFSFKMNTLQAANYNKVSLNEFEKREDIENALHEYIVNLDETNMSDRQKFMVSENLKTSQLLIRMSKEKGLKQYEHLWDKGVEYHLEPSEIDQMLRDLGTTRVQAFRDALQAKADKGNASDEDIERLDLLNQLAEVEKYKSDIINYGRLDEFNESEFGKSVKQCNSEEDKVFIYANYMKNKCENLPPKDAAKFYDEMICDLVNKGDTELALKLKTGQIIQASHKEKIAIVQNGDAPKPSALMTAMAVEGLGNDTEALEALEQTQRSWQEEDPEFATKLSVATIHNATEDQNVHLSAVYADKDIWDEKTQMAVADAGLKCEKAENQREILTNTAQKSSTNVKISTGIQLDKAKKENQCILTEEFTKDKEVNDAMVADGTFTRFDKENRTDAFKIHKSRYEQPDYSKKDAIKGLNNLSDWIGSEAMKGDKEAQLAMHNEMMTSKYSEVIEHVAGNIKNYDSAIQSKAMDSVYASGNQKAIETAQNNIKFIGSSEVRNLEASRAIGETILQTANSDELKQKFLNGDLSMQEVKNLPLSERRDYINRYFAKLPANQKIKFLQENISSASMRKTVYTAIARTDSTLFNEICKDKDRVDMLLGLGLPEDVNNKIKTVVSFIAVSDVGFQGIAEKYDIEFDRIKDSQPKTAITVPPAFAKEIDGFEFFRQKDKLGREYIKG